MIRSAVLAVFTLFLTSAPALAAERLAVLELQAKHLSADERTLLSDEVRGAVVETVGRDIQVMTRENMEVMLSDMGIDASCVSEGACEVETARNLGVDFVVSGTVVDLSGKQVASLKLHQTENGQLLASKRTQGADTFALLEAIGPLTVSLLGPLADERKPETEDVGSTPEKSDQGPTDEQLAAWAAKTAPGLIASGSKLIGPVSQAITADVNSSSKVRRLATKCAADQSSGGCADLFVTGHQQLGTIGEKLAGDLGLAPEVGNADMAMRAWLCSVAGRPTHSGVHPGQCSSGFGTHMALLVDAGGGALFSAVCEPAHGATICAESWKEAEAAVR